MNLKNQSANKPQTLSPTQINQFIYHASDFGIETTPLPLDPGTDKMNLNSRRCAEMAKNLLCQMISVKTHDQ